MVEVEVLVVEVEVVVLVVVVEVVVVEVVAVDVVAGIISEYAKRTTLFGRRYKLLGAAY